MASLQFKASDLSEGKCRPDGAFEHSYQLLLPKYRLSEALLHYYPIDLLLKYRLSEAIFLKPIGLIFW